MQINQKQFGDELVISLEGRLDTTTAPNLEAVINTISDSVKNLVIDMHKVEYVSSAGLRVLLAIQKKMNNVGTLKLTGVNETVMEVFQMTGFSDILKIE